MRRPVLAVFLSLLMLACQAVAAERGALFKVTGHGHTLYLFGTAHVGRPDFYPLEPRIQGALAAARTLVLEIDPMRDPAAMAAAFQRHAVFPSGSAGIAGLPPARRAHIENALRKHGVDPARVAQLKPWALAMMLSLADIARLGYRPDLAVDLHLARLARTGKTRIGELEAVGYQMSLFGRLTDDEQWRLLEETLEYMQSGRQQREIRELLDAYGRADRQAFERIAERIEREASVTARFTREVLLQERNRPMADKLAALLARENNAVAAVGVLHLLGSRGLPELLRKRGLKVERVY